MQLYLWRGALRVGRIVAPGGGASNSLSRGASVVQLEATDIELTPTVQSRSGDEFVSADPGFAGLTVSDGADRASTTEVIHDTLMAATAPDQVLEVRAEDGTAAAANMIQLFRAPVPDAGRSVLDGAPSGLWIVMWM